MTKLKIIFPILLFFASFSVAQTGYEGDNFSLEGAIEIFKKSNSIEDFEKRINEENSYVNNLDLNQDGEIDYLRVEDKMDGNVHAIVIQAPINSGENQDVAVIEIEQTGNENALLQIIGDAEIFGEQTIVEPFEEVAESNGSGGPSADYNFRRGIINVYFWSPVRFIYRPSYRPYVSQYRWRNYPRTWTPWRPRTFNVYHQRRGIYQRNYRVVNTHRVVNAHRIYTPHRRTSPIVTKRTATVRVARTNSRNGKPTTKTTNRKNNKTGTRNNKTGTKTKKQSSKNKSTNKRNNKKKRNNDNNYR